MTQTSRRFPRSGAMAALLAVVCGAWPAAPLSPASAAGADRALEVALQQLPALIDGAMARTGVPGLVVVVVQDDRVVLLRGYGTRRLGSGMPVDGDTVFQLASLSKPIATTVIAALVGDGRIGWDTPLSQRLPEVRIGGPAIAPKITLRDLLSHRSGLPDHAGDDLEDLGFDRATILSRLALFDTANRFRASYAYTNFGFTAAGEAAARAGGSDWEELSAQRLYRPLGMTRTSSRHADFLATPNRADLHQRQGARWRLSPGRQPDAQSPAGGVSASGRDLARWMRLQLNRGRLDGRTVVQAEALDETHRPQVISVPPADPVRDQAGIYALGWNVGYDPGGRLRLSHSGAFSLGAATSVTLLPARRLGIAILTNGTPIGVPESLTASFLDLLDHGRVRRDYGALMAEAFASILRPDYPLVSEPPRPPALALERYTGTYRNAYVGEARVNLVEGRLQLSLGPRNRTAALTSLGNHRFAYTPFGENAAGPSAVSFSVDRKGHGTQLRIDNLNTHGLGTLQRSAAP
ncbi:MULTISPECIES: serine hydrolase [Aphanothece]|uniref:serine hydrolase n=1 Tax=Aphanothece TaxID=1121 RepID=UPI00398EAEC0